MSSAFRRKGDAFSPRLRWKVGFRGQKLLFWAISNSKRCSSQMLKKCQFIGQIWLWKSHYGLVKMGKSRSPEVREFSQMHKYLRCHYGNDRTSWLLDFWTSPILIHPGITVLNCRPLWCISMTWLFLCDSCRHSCLVFSHEFLPRAIVAFARVRTRQL